MCYVLVVSVDAAYVVRQSPYFCFVCISLAGPPAEGTVSSQGPGAVPARGRQTQTTGVCQPGEGM